jgi:outer membrane lipoprotein SlyB
MKFQVLCITGTIVLASLLTGCAPDISAGTYTTDQVGQAAATAPGVIVAATPVKVNSSSGSTIGTVAGAVAGGVAGSTIGGGSRANILGGLGGALVGGAIGNYAGEKLSTQTGMQYTVRLKNGRMFTVTQGMDPVLSVRQHVMVIFSNPARVVAAY